MVGPEKGGNDGCDDGCEDGIEVGNCKHLIGDMLST